MGLIMTVIIGAVSLGLFMTAIPAYVKSVDASYQRARVKRHLANTEAAIRVVLQSPTSYQCSGNGGVSNCQLTTFTGGAGPASGLAQIESLMGAMDPLLCMTPNSNCQLEITEPPHLFIQSGATRPTVRLAFAYTENGQPTSFRPVEIEVDPHQAVLQDHQFRCNGMFLGFNADGSIRCQPINLNRAPPGHFISALAGGSLAPTFTSLPVNVTNCAVADKYLSAFQWTGGMNYSYSCGDRIEF